MVRKHVSEHLASRHGFSQWRPHPWHGLSPGPQAPARVFAYIEITPFDLVKYELDRETGYLKVDRPQFSSSLPPTLYGFIPRTYSGPRVAALSPNARKGDGDPLDICVVSGSPINKAEVILEAKVLGGLRTIDKEAADDKLIAVLAKDTYWSQVEDVDGLPTNLIDRLRHYFSTYKMVPLAQSTVHVEGVFGRVEAVKVVEAGMQDYRESFGE